LRAQFWINHVGVYKVFLLSLKFYDFLDSIIRNTFMFIEEFFLWALNNTCRYSDQSIGDVEQVVVLVLMVVSTAASSLGLSGLRGINISMYIRLLVPIVFSRYIPD
jgi:hypothetical protein